MKAKNIKRYGMLIIPPLLLVGLTAFNYRSPVIENIQPNWGDQEHTMNIVGRHFGDERGRSYVTLAGQEVPPSYYQEWTDAMIRITIPPDTNSGVVRVTHQDRESNIAIFVTNTQSTHSVNIQQRPYIRTHTPAEPAIGDVVTIEGKSFGPTRGTSVIWMSWYGSQGSQHRIAIPGDNYYEWSHTKVVFRLPSGISRGSLVMTTDYGDSNTYAINIDTTAGNVRYSNPTVIAFHYGASVVTGSEPTYLWLPTPPIRSFQHEVYNLYYQYDFYHTVAGHIQKIVLEPHNSPVNIERSFMLRRYQTEYTLQTDRIPLKYDTADFYPYLSSPLSLVVINQIKAMVQNIRGHPFNKVQQVYRLLQQRFTPATVAANKERPEPPVRITLEELLNAEASQQRIHSYHYTVMAVAMLQALEVPARPVAGYILVPHPASIYTASTAINDHWQLLAHYWVEYWMPKVGWIPMDIAMGDGYMPPPPGVVQSVSEGAVLTEESLAQKVREFYLTGVDSHRIGLSYGWHTMPSITQGQQLEHQSEYAVFLSHQYEAKAVDSNAISFYPVRLIGMVQ